MGWLIVNREDLIYMYIFYSTLASRSKLLINVHRYAKSMHIVHISKAVYALIFYKENILIYVLMYLIIVTYYLYCLKKS